MLGQPEVGKRQCYTPSEGYYCPGIGPNADGEKAEAETTE